MPSPRFPRRPGSQPPRQTPPPKSWRETLQDYMNEAERAITTLSDPIQKALSNEVYWQRRQRAIDFHTQAIERLSTEQSELRKRQVDADRRHAEAIQSLRQCEAAHSRSRR